MSRSQQSSDSTQGGALPTMKALQNMVTVVAVVPTLAEADEEVARLNDLNGDRARYVRAHTRWYPQVRRTQ